MTHSATAERTLPVILRALAHRNYRIYFTGQLVSLIGTWMQQVALIWLTYRITDSTFMLGLVTFAGQVPLLVLSPLGGVLSDRLDRRTLLLWTQWFSLGHALLLAVLSFTVTLDAWLLASLALLLGLINSIDQPVRQSFIAELVEKRDDIANAVALTSVTIHSSRFAGPAIGGLVIAVAGEAVCFVINALTFLAMIVALHVIRPRAVPRRHHGIVDALRSGLGYAYAHERIRVLLFIVTIMSFFGTAQVTLLPWFARDVFAGGAESFGFLSAAVGIGSCLGALFLASRPDAASIDRNIGRAAILAGSTLLCFAFTGSFWAAIPELVLLGFCSINVVAASNALIQAIVDDEMRGRVMSIFTVAFFGVSPLGSLAAGSAASFMSPRGTLMVCALVILAAGSFVYVELRNQALRRADVDALVRA